MDDYNPPSPTLSYLPQMDLTSHPVNHGEPSSSDWTDFLDFDLQDQFPIPFQSHHLPDFPPVTEPKPPPPPPVPTSSDNSDRVRKRDPRLVCSNFLAGRIPCACPELDAMLEEAESEPGKKRARSVRAAAGTARCQVPGCEADISELKGYHRRHKVCLQCANASAVILEGQNKRYCQQCGKFHILEDFDEGKRSCRRKLERHNNRRRRKQQDSEDTVDKDAQQATSSGAAACDNNNTNKESEFLNIQSIEEAPPPCSADGSHNIQSDEQKDELTNSPSYMDDKSAFSSMCPTGRISFKLYDWNPAEFPRRLRHQIFQWLASMPVELEGYIRPGCTILTVFISMPAIMWVKLYEEPVACIQNLVASGNMLSGRGNFVIYLNNMIFRVNKGGSSVIKVKAEERVPKLHYVHPMYFEAGKPVEFVVCGSNLRQPKFRFLLSFGGKYLKYDVHVHSPSGNANANKISDHQLLKIYVPRTDRNQFGPAFVEVENEAGISNFIPILIGNKEICSEMEKLQQNIYSSSHSRRSNISASSSLCEDSALEQKENYEFILHMAWLLKDPSFENLDHVLNSSQIQRFNFVLEFLVQNKSTAILDRVLYYMKIVTNNSPDTSIADTDMRLFEQRLNQAQDFLSQHLQKNEEDSRKGSENHVLCVVESSSIPLLQRNVDSNSVAWSRNSCRTLLKRTRKLSTSRPVIFVIAAAAMCFGVCTVVLHPQKVGRLASTIHRCLFYNP